MQLTARFIFLASALTAACSSVAALSIGTGGNEVLRNVNVRTAPAKAVFEYHEDGTALMAPHDVELVRRASWTYNNNKQLLMGVLVQNGAVATAACALGNPLTCGIGVLYSTFTFFFAAWLFQDRADTSGISDAYFVYPPTPEKTVRQRLTTELEPGKWHSVGHVQHKGLNHTVEYFNAGTHHQLRARTAPFANATLAARIDEDNDGGFVGDFFWQSNNEGPYDSFDSSDASTTYFADNAGGWMIDSADAIAACAQFTDGDGALDDGIVSIGWNNQPYEWEPGQMGVYFDDCASNPQSP